MSHCHRLLTSVRKSMREHVIILTVLLASVAEAAPAQTVRREGGDTMIEQQVLDVMSRLDSLDDAARFRLISKVDADRNTLLGILLKHLGGAESVHVRAAAAYMIGRHRLSEGVPALMRQIDLEAPPSGEIGREPLWEKYPAMEALIHIGRPAVPPALELLATDGSRLRRSLALRVVRYAEGADVAEFILQRAIAREADPERRGRLDSALAELRAAG
jgi:hypothetical protein